MAAVYMVTEKLPVDIRVYLRNKDHNLSILAKDRYFSVISAGTKERTTLDGLGDFRKQGKSVHFGV